MTASSRPKLRLWVLPWGLYPRRVTIYLKEKGILEHFEIIPVNITQDGQEPAEGKPPGSMPILEISPPSEPGASDGRYIYQSTAIVEHLEDVCGPDSGTPSLRGRDAEEVAKVRERMDVLNEGVAMFGLYTHQSSKLFNSMEEQSIAAARMARKRMNQMLDLLEIMADAEGPWLVGSRLTLVDCILMATLQFAWVVYGVDLCEGRPKLRRVFEEFKKRPSAKMEAVPDGIQSLAQELSI